MSNHERTRRRLLDFSQWHREYMPEDAGMIDIDGIAYCNACLAPLLVYESVAGNQEKSTKVVERVAAGLEVPATLVRTYGNATIHAVQRAPIRMRIGGAEELAAYETVVRAAHVCHV